MKKRFADIALYRDDLKRVIDTVDGIDRLYGADFVLSGSSGMIGSFLADILLYLNETRNAHIKIVAIGRNMSSVRERFGDRSDLTFEEFDLKAPTMLHDNADYVIHAAGNSDPAAFNRDPVGTINGNIAGTGALLDFASARQCRRFLYVSSGEVYGQGRMGDDPYKEDYGGYVDPMSVRSCYPMSKRAAETLCAAYGAQHGLDTVVVRPSHIYGPCFRQSDSHAYVQFLQNALNGNDIVLKSKGASVRSYSYVADCAAGILLALIGGSAGEAYNIANPDSIISIAELAKEIAAAAGVGVTYSDPGDEDIRNMSPIVRQVLDAGKLMKLGYRPQYTVKEGIRHTFEILKEL